MDSLKGIFQNHVYVVELLVIGSIILILLFVFYSLGLIKIPK